jgi:hypothetical protein
MVIFKKTIEEGSAADPHHADAYPDPPFVGFQGPLLLHFEPLKLLNFWSDARIRICL